MGENSLIVLKSNSHRASDKLRRYYNLTDSYYHDDLLNITSKGGFWIVSEEIAGYILKGNGKEWYQMNPVKGITKAKDQNVEHYNKCWSFTEWNNRENK